MAAVAVGDIASGEVSSLGDYIREGAVGAVCGAVFSPLGPAGSLFGRMAVGSVEGMAAVSQTS